MRCRINNENVDLNNIPELNKNKKHTIDLMIDRLAITKNIIERLTSAVELALKDQ